MVQRTTNDVSRLPASIYHQYLTSHPDEILRVSKIGLAVDSHRMCADPDRDLKVILLHFLVYDRLIARLVIHRRLR